MNSLPKKEFVLKNPRINHDTEDILYHLALGNKSHNLVEMFGDVKFICMGGTPQRMEAFAYYIMQELGIKLSPGTMLQDLSAKSHRYGLFKIGPIIAVSHGMGMPSLNILMHELIKLMYHAGVKSPIIFRLGTCGGIGLEPGSVVITTESLNGKLEPFYNLTILGKDVRRPTTYSIELAEKIKEAAVGKMDFEVTLGKTVSTDDFYEGQARLDGAFCDYNEQDKMDFLKRCSEIGVKNFEMESGSLAAITNHVGIQCAVICVTLLDRLKGDQVNASKETMIDFQNRPMKVVAEFLKKHLCPDRASTPKISSDKCIPCAIDKQNAQNCSGHIIVSDKVCLEHVLDECEAFPE